MADRLIGSLPAPGIPGCGATRVTRPGPLRLIPRPGPASHSTQRPVRTVRVKVAGAVKLTGRQLRQRVRLITNSAKRGVHIMQYM